ncbi:MAG: tRNA adenosine(34) deaminase TadA [Candidatus Aminicenantes bacterium]|nr:tRNA adenosine(34) deaminase TadA [Candidatus Aminicenantes bacterium]MBL7083240.1 tRNA adenosine(34) deaminase TadA [Candidatus Aminicenantes bacterium]
MRNDEFFMRQALVEANKSLGKGEVPVGAVLISGNKVLSRAFNEPIRRNDPTAHAEIIALRKACLKRRNYRLPDCDLYVTLEPCVMCIGAAVHARIRRLVFGAYDPKSGAVESVMNFPFEKMNHRIETKGGVLADECSRILKDFFSIKRASKK